MSSPNSIPILSTERIRLRPFTLDDAKDVQRLAGDPRIASTTGSVPHPYPDGAAESWISKHAEWFEQGQSVDWAIELLSAKCLIGSVSLGINRNNNRAELGYWIGANFWNQGYCTEAARLAVKYGFEKLNLNKITSRHMAQNPSSGRVMEKVGMQKEGYLQQDFLKNEVYIDMVVYGLLKEKFLSQR